ncbi:hypothetical protein HUJ04_002457 [Dendroctonus ponderosae]|nr:hypothetical protein HUJ04_002457 [Dendroctonus ponderosae]
MSQCKKFAPNIFHKSKCSNCFRQKEEHSAEALECNRLARPRIPDELTRQSITRPEPVQYHSHLRPPQINKKIFD